MKRCKQLCQALSNNKCKQKEGGSERVVTLKHGVPDNEVHHRCFSLRGIDVMLHIHCAQHLQDSEQGAVKNGHPSSYCVIACRSSLMGTGSILCVVAKPRNWPQPQCMPCRAYTHGQTSGTTP